MYVSYVAQSAHVLLFLGVVLYVCKCLQFVLRLIDLALQLLNTVNHVSFVYFENIYRYIQRERERVRI